MAKNIKINDADCVESINVYLSREKTPVAFQNKLKELMDCKAFDTEEEAIKWIETTPIELELYYETGQGLFGVESEVVENFYILNSPYSDAKLICDPEVNPECYED